MKVLRPLMSAFFVMAATGLRAAEVPAATPPASPYAILESFVDGVWIAELPMPKGAAPMTIELQFAWAENKQGLRFHSDFVQDGKHRPYTSGMYAWNGAKGKLAIFYTDSSASLTEGTITVEDNVLVHELVVTDPAGKAEPVKVRLTKISAGAFLNQIYLQKNGAWEKFVEVRYERHL